LGLKTYLLGLTDASSAEREPQRLVQPKLSRCRTLIDTPSRLTRLAELTGAEWVDVCK